MIQQTKTLLMHISFFIFLDFFIADLSMSISLYIFALGAIAGSCQCHVNFLKPQFCLAIDMNF